MDGDTVQANIDDQPGISGGFNPLALIDSTLSDAQLNNLAGSPSTDAALASGDESLLSQLGAPSSATGLGSIFGNVPSWFLIGAVGLVVVAVMMRK
ncbi:MAG TPA: hypothetical protein VGF92_05480 [Stellaceae bacterium]|jgi:hypothetical protein